MAIIYSYTKVQQPALSDLLIGTDVSTKNKVTKSFSIQSIVDLVETAVPGGGTVTNIATANSTFVTLTGGPISTTGTITAALSATGAASATTFLRGDNTWATIPSSSNTTYTLSSAQNGSAANIRLTGSTGSQNIVTLLAGANITLTDNGLNGIVISSTASGGGSCASANAGTGLKIESGSVGSNPFIGVDYLGSNNYILKGESQTTITQQDYIPFNDISTGNVKTTTMGVIPPSALSLVKNYIDAGDANDITNDTDAYTTTAKVEKVVSLTSAEYASITPNANTLYLIVGALPTYTVTLAFTNTISGTEYTIGGSQAGATQVGISGSSYAFNTTITPNAGFYFSSGPVITNATGTITTNETVYTLLSGTVEAIPTPQCTATLDVNTTGIQGTQFTLGGSLTGATATGDCPLDITGVFNTTITVNPGYEFTTGPVIENATGVISGNQTVETCITGVIEAIAAPVTVTPNAVNNFTANGFENQVTLSVSPGSISGDSPLDYSFTGSATPNSNYEISNLSISGLNGQATVSGTVDIIFTGTITEIENEIIVNDTPVNNIQGPSAGYTITYSPPLKQITGTTPSLTYEFAHSVALNSGYKWVNDVIPTVTNAQGTLTVAGTYAVQSTIGNPGQSTVELIPDIVAELDVTYNITGDNVWSPAGNLDGTQQSGPAPLTYNFDTYANGTPTITIPANYQFVSGPTTLPVSISGTINSNTIVPVTVTAEIAEILEPGEVILTFSNNVNGSQNTTTALGATTTISGNAGDPYTFTNSITADPGYEFTSPAVWTPSSIITGTIAAGTTNITQSVTGTVTAIVKTVTLAFTNNVSGSENATTSLSPGSSITDTPGDSYQFIHTITPNSGYEFTSGPTWVDNVSNNGTGTINGTIPSSNTTITQSVSGTVTAIAVPQYYALQKCATGGSGFTTNLNTDQLTLSTGDIVVDTAPNPDEYYTVLADRPTVQGSTFVSLTGLNNCPTPLYYYESVQCSGTGTARVSSEDPNLTSADSYTYNSVCYEIVGSDPTQNPSYDITGLVDGCCTATLTSFTTTSISQSSGADACAQPKTQTRSHDGGGALPTTGDTVYLGSTIGSGNVGAGFWGLLNNTYYQTNSSGVVTSVQACPVVDGTVNLTVTNQVANSSYTVNPASQTITDTVGDSYTFTTTVVPNSGYELVPGTIQYNGLPNGIQSGTISAETTEITQTITGQTRLLEYYTLTKCDPNGGPGFVSFVDIYDSINGTVANPPLSNDDTVYDAGNDYYYTVTGTTTTQGSTGLSSYTGGTGCPAPLYYYNVVQCSGTGTDKVSSEVANLTSDYSYTYNSVCYKIVDTDPTQTPSYDITSLPSGCCTGTVNVDFTNNVVGKENTTTLISDGGTASTSGDVGTSYNIANSITANNGYEFTAGPTWSTGGTGDVSGTFTSGVTGISQSVTGTVVLTQYYALQKCSTGGSGFTTNRSVGQLTLSTNDIVLDTGEGVYYKVLSGRPTTQGSVFVDLTALNDCPAPLYYWNAVQCSGTGTVKISTTDALIGPGDSYTFNSVCYKIVDTDVSQTPAYNIDTFSGCCTATVNVNFTNSVVGKANTTTTIADGGTTSATGLVGTSYSITNSISANSGYGFTSGPTWSTGGTGTVTGTFTSGTTNIAQDVTGTVTASITVYAQQITAQEDGGFGTPSTTAADAKTELCFDFLPFSAYSEDANITDAVQLNARWFADSQGTNPFSGAFKWYGVGTPNDLGAVYVIRLSDAGVVTEVTTAC